MDVIISSAKGIAIRLRCKKHDWVLRFIVSDGDTIELYPWACPMCIKEAKEAGKNEIKGERND